MIDPATGWFEIEEVVADRGTEFMGECLLMVRKEYGLARKLITARNPQANAIIERCHQTLHNLVHTYQLHTKVKDEAYNDIVTGILNSVRRAINSTVHTTLQALPMQLVLDATRSSQSAFKLTGIILPIGSSASSCKTTHAKILNVKYTFIA